MDQNEQDFLREIRALIDNDDGAPADMPEEPAPEQPRREQFQPEPRQRRERKRTPPEKKQARGKSPKATRAKKEPKEHMPFPWALLFLTLLVIAGLIYAGLQYYRDVNTLPTEPAVTESAEPETEPAAVEPGQTVTIAAVGDVTITDELLAAARQADGTYDFARTFLNVTPLLTQADIAVANLDLNFCGEPYGAASHSAPYALADALAGAGIDIAQAANSYSISNGMEGLSATLTAIRQAGMEPLGAYPDETSYQSSRGITVCEVNGMRVVFMAFTKGLDNLSLPEGHEHCVNLLYQDYDATYSEVDTEGITAVLEAAAAQKPDITIAVVHWGSEYSTEISSTQKTIRALLLNGGVDVILGTHSHRVGELEVETGKEGTTVTAYSLGNFYGDDSYTGTQASLVLQLEFTMDNLTGKAVLTDVSYTPLYIASPSQSTTGGYEILDIPASLALKERSYIGCVSDSVYEALLSARQSIANALGDSIDIWKDGQ